jgi:hypothetical protein
MRRQDTDNSTEIADIEEEVKNCLLELVKIKDDKSSTDISDD